MSGILFLDGGDHGSHILQASIGVVFFVVLALHDGGEGSSMYIIDGNESDGGILC